MRREKKSEINGREKVRGKKNRDSRNRERKMAEWKEVRKILEGETIRKDK